MTLAPPRPGAIVKVRGIVGEAAERPDGVPKVTGEFAYASDLQAEGMLFGQTVRSPHAHARIASIDASAAKAMPGVHAVLTHREVPGQMLFGLEQADQPVLAVDRVRFVGEPVAIVAAESAEQARLAARAVRVEYEPLAAVTDPIAALRDDAPRLHERGNVIKDVHVRHGDAAAARADVVVEGEYEVAMQDQAALGPEAGLAIPDRDGGVTLHIATQWLHADRDQIAPCLGLPKEKVRLVLGGVGGAFGAREDVTLQIHVCMLALTTKRRAHDLRSGGVVLRTRPPSSRPPLLRARRGPGRAPRVRARDDRAGRRRVRVVQRRRRRQRGLLRRRPLSRAERARALRGRVHEQSADRRDARLRRGAVVLRVRGSD
ncbi:MAG: hypothetical protein AUH85_18545 [Chloroflexi bacterium 13_1_40CM_4_68_4]|nr:MAG: hypothetical protein AUH85_18545 [Chloroflexi bacterium 13_1_40CM_4_68_4]